MATEHSNPSLTNEEIIALAGRLQERGCGHLFSPEFRQDLRQASDLLKRYAASRIRRGSDNDAGGNDYE
jgi:hypothetical protein